MQSLVLALLVGIDPAEEVLREQATASWQLFRTRLGWHKLPEGAGPRIAGPDKYRSVQ
jgi:hypothetical protein